MKKWICLLLCGTLIMSSVLTMGTPIMKQQKILTNMEKSLNDVTPILSYIDINVDIDGSIDVEIDCGPKDWTGDIHNASFVITINNPWNNTGSISFRWRIAEYPLEGFLGWLLFWLKHGNIQVVPSVLQPNFLGTTKLKIEWISDDPDVKIYNETIGIDIVPDNPIQIAMWLYHKGNHDYCYYYYTPLNM